jgi:hypothetical protein
MYLFFLQYVGLLSDQHQVVTVVVHQHFILLLLYTPFTFVQLNY